MSGRLALEVSNARLAAIFFFFLADRPCPGTSIMMFSMHFLPTVDNRCARYAVLYSLIWIQCTRRATDHPLLPEWNEGWAVCPRQAASVAEFHEP